MEADSPPGPFRRRHQSSDSVEHPSELSVVFPFKDGELLRQIPVSRHQLPEPDKGLHDGDVDLDGTFTVQHAGTQGDSLLREGHRKIAPTAVTRT